MSQSRQQRRAAERQERKNLRKQMAAESSTTVQAEAKLDRNCLPPEVAARHAQEERDLQMARTNPHAYLQRMEQRALEAEQAERNRKNAQHSTGPRTDSGKATSSKNSLKHGLYSKEQQHMSEEEMKSFHNLKMSFVKEYNPSGPTEMLLIHQMTEHFIRLQRFQKMEANMMANDETPISHLSAVHRFLNSAERGFHKNLKALREIQKEKAKAATTAKTSAVSKGPAVSGAVSSGFVPHKPQTASETSNTARSQSPAVSESPAGSGLKQAA